MDITDIQIELVASSSDRLRGFCRVIFDNEFMVRDIRILEGNQGLFVAMPSRKVMRPCPGCREKNHLAASFCNECGSKLPQAVREATPDQRAFADIAHPINADCREKVQGAILQAYHLAIRGAKFPTLSPSQPIEFRERSA